MAVLLQLEFADTAGSCGKKTRRAGTAYGYWNPIRPEYLKTKLLYAKRLFPLQVHAMKSGQEWSWEKESARLP